MKNKKMKKLGSFLFRILNLKLGDKMISSIFFGKVPLVGILLLASANPEGGGDCVIPQGRDTGEGCS